MTLLLATRPGVDAVTRASDRAEARPRYRAGVR